jgi:predicted metal-dependent hydrolase
MALALEDYKRLTARLDLDGIAFDAFRDQPLAPDALRVVRFMHDVEQHTACYTRNLLNTKAHLDPEISTFLTLWNYEEHWHGDALAQVLAAHDEPFGAQRVATMRDRLRFQLTSGPLVWMAVSAATRHFLAVHMTFGVINEWTTQAGYARLIARARHPMLTDLVRRIMKQEGRHIDFYLGQARSRLAASAGARRATRTMVRAMWKPVGASVMPQGETRHLVRTLFADSDGRAVAARVDRRVDSLPGLDGLGLMAGALSTYR